MNVYDDSAAGAGANLKSGVVIKCRKNWRLMPIGTLLGEANCACWMTSWLLNSWGSCWRISVSNWANRVPG